MGGPRGGGALENALNATWQVKGRGITSRLVAVAWLVGAGLLFLGSMALGPLLNELPGPATVATILAGFVLDVLLFVWMFVVLTSVNLPWRVHLPGALLGAVGLEVLKVVGSVFVPGPWHRRRRSTGRWAWSSPSWPGSR